MFVMNHLHWSDPVIGMAIVSRPAYTFVADKWEHRPVLGFLMRFTKQVIFVHGVRRTVRQSVRPSPC